MSSAELLAAFTDQLASSPPPELQTFRRTLLEHLLEAEAGAEQGHCEPRPSSFSA